EDGIRDRTVTGVQTCALPIYPESGSPLRLCNLALQRQRSHAERSQSESGCSERDRNFVLRGIESAGAVLSRGLAFRPHAGEARQEQFRATRRHRLASYTQYRGAQVLRALLYALRARWTRSSDAH